MYVYIICLKDRATLNSEYSWNVLFFLSGYRLSSLGCGEFFNNSCCLHRVRFVQWLEAVFSRSVFYPIFDLR